MMTDLPPPQPADGSETPNLARPIEPPGAPPIAPPLLPPQPVAPPPAGDWTAAAPAASATTKPPSKARLYIIGAVVLVLVVVGGYFISQNQRADELVVGQCFDEPGSSVDITTVVKHACTEAHDAEVFNVVEYNDGDAYPISMTVRSFIEETCVPAFATYVGESYDESTDYNLGYFYPDSTGWGQGDRTLTCYITREDGTKLTQSVKGAAS
jgi:hypothetical protein